MGVGEEGPGETRVSEEADEEEAEPHVREMCHLLCGEWC